MEDEVLSPEDLMTFLKIDQAALEKLMQVGEIPGRYVGGHWRFSKHSVLRWLGEMSMAEVVAYAQQLQIKQQERFIREKEGLPPEPAARFAGGHREPAEGEAPRAPRIHPRLHLAAENFNILTPSQKGDLLAGME